jgi:hypothetical protein
MPRISPCPVNWAYHYGMYEDVRAIGKTRIWWVNRFADGHLIFMNLLLMESAHNDLVDLSSLDRDDAGLDS